MCDSQRIKNEYNSKVLINGWYDGRVLEEEAVKDFLIKRDNGQLMIQKMGSLLKQMTQPSEISTSSDGFMKFGDWIQLLNPGSDPNLLRMHKTEPRRPTVVSIDASDEMLYFQNEMSDPSSCTASIQLNPMARNSFQLISPTNDKTGQKVTYGEPVVFKTSDLLGPSMYLSSDNCEYVSKTKRGKFQEISVISKMCYLCYFYIEYIDPRYRLENEGSPVEVNKKCIVKHAKSNQKLCVQSKFFEKTFFGNEHEVCAKTYYDDHKAEKDCNQWIFRPKELTGGNTEHTFESQCQPEEKFL